MLLLPELSSIAANTDAVKTTISLYPHNVMTTHKLFNEELSDNNEYELLHNDVDSAKILVSGLTSSWTHVNIFMMMFDFKIHTYANYL